jgi:hypothetical protein
VKGRTYVKQERLSRPCHDRGLNEGSWN